MSSARPMLSIIVPTYNWPQALDAVLASLFEQDDAGFEIIVADDGSGPETRAVIEKWHSRSGPRLSHVWQPDEGYRRARSLNLGASGGRGEYFLFVDGDCLVRRGFVAAVRRAALPGWFLASKRVNLSPELSRRVIDESLPVWRWSVASWFLRAPRELLSSHRESARPGLLLPVRDRRRPWRGNQPEFRPPYDGYGFMFGVDRRDFEQANGFDMRFVSWGGEDKDLATRLRHAGLRCGWPGGHATVLHLWHSVRKGAPGSNASLVAEAEASGRVEALDGLRELADQVSAKRVGASSSSREPEKR